jgi:hypothetical protein
MRTAQKAMEIVSTGPDFGLAMIGLRGYLC